MASTVQCPNCNQAVTSDSKFCIFCGIELPAPVYIPGGHSASSDGNKKAIKKCKNGHTFDDASLVYCPECGLPFEETTEPIPLGKTWTCDRGHVNPADNAFCEYCGLPREPKVRLSSSSDTKSSTTNIPEGMYTPTDADLEPKKRANKQ